VRSITEKKITQEITTQQDRYLVDTVHYKGFYLGLYTYLFI